MRLFTLDERLKAIEDMIEPCDLVADIGADHGRLGAHLLMTQRARRVAFVELSVPSLEKARALTRRLGIEDRSAFLVGDGAAPLTEPPDYAVIAGMGGETIAHIVESGQSALKDATLVMQPNVAQYALRRRLMRAGYLIADECIRRAGGRLYVIIKARPGATAYSDTELLVGPVLLSRRDEGLLNYAQFQIKVATKALRGAVSAGDEAAEELKWTLDGWKEALSWLQR